MEKAIAYIRVSTDDQASEGHVSLDVQKQNCIREANLKGYRVAHVFEDPGHSGGTIKRPGLLSMLANIEEDDTIKVVFVQHTDRLARDVGVHTTIRNELKKHNVKIYSLAQGGIIKDDPDAKMFDGVLAVFNAHQRDIIIYKTREALIHKAKSGWLPTLAPVGYLNQEVKKEKIIVVDKKKAKLVKKLFKLYATGNYSAAQLSDKLYPLGLSSHSNKKIYPSKIYELLRNRFCIGELHYSEVHLKKANHPPIVDKKLFNSVQEMIDYKNKYACRQRKYNFLLRGFIFCRTCGNRYTTEKHIKKDKSYYHCSGRACESKSKYVPVDILEKLVEEKFKTIEFSEDFIELTVDKVKLIYKKRKAEVGGERQGFINQRTAIEKKIEIAEDKLINGTISDKAFTRINKRNEDELNKIDEKIADLEVVRKVNAEEIKKILLLTRDVYQAYKQADKEFKRYYLSFFWERLEVKNKKITLAKPSKLFQAMLDLQKASLKRIQKPSPVLEKVSVQNSLKTKHQRNNEKIIMYAGKPELVLLRTEMGG